MGQYDVDEDEDKKIEDEKDGSREGMEEAVGVLSLRLMSIWRGWVNYCGGWLTLIGCFQVSIANPPATPISRVPCTMTTSRQ
jgi:hypothetical protein